MQGQAKTGFRISDVARENYYRQGYWGETDFWTTFAHVAETHWNKVALIDENEAITFSELYRRAQLFATAARKQGLKKGEVVVIHGRHCIEAVVTILGCAYSGLVPALLPAMFSEEQIGGILDHTGATLLVGLGVEKEVERVRAAVATHPGVTLILAESAQDVGNHKSWSQFNDIAPEQLIDHVPMDPDDLLLLIFSSGTTGAPKGVMHSTNTARFAVNGYADMHQVNSDDVELVVTAFGFVGSSLLGFYLTLVRGCTSVLLRNWSPEETLEAIEKHRASHFLLMPTHAIDVLSCADLDERDCNSVTRGVVAGVSEEYRLDAKSRLCTLPFPMYGMSESPAHVTGSMTDDWEDLRATEGKNMPGTELLICDDDGKPVPVGEPGNILVRGPNRFLGYYKADHLNEDAISEDGYFRTGDIGVLDTKGCMTFVSRSKDIIRRGGVTITPADIEEALRSHENVKDVAVIGVPDPRLGERICACIIASNDEELSLQEVTTYLDSKGVARYLWPEMVIMCEVFPRTPSLKVQKNQLKKDVEKILAARTA